MFLIFLVYNDLFSIQYKIKPTTVYSSEVIKLMQKIIFLHKTIYFVFTRGSRSTVYDILLECFSRDADEMENWIAEKLQLATEESYKDPANIQSKHQKHQAFEAELAANADRIQSVLAMGQNLIDKHQCAGSEEAVQVCHFKCNYFYVI